MNQDQRAIAQLFFKLRLHKSTGQAYENLLIEVLTASEMDFTPVKPQGRVGDRGNDGFDRTTGTYFQVYAPENPKSAATVAKAVNKANADFAGLYDYWNTIHKIERYYFAFNDRYQGTQPTLEQALANIKQRYGLADAKVFLAKDLEDHFMRLDYNRMVNIIGFLPNPAAFPVLDGPALYDVLNHILSAQAPSTPLGTLTAPDFDRKLVFNGFGPQVQTMLRGGSYHAGPVEDYFLANSAFEAQRVRDRINRIYQKIAAKLLIADHVFLALVDELVPEQANLSHHHAACILIAYYVESCDVFDDPEESDATSQ